MINSVLFVLGAMYSTNAKKEKGGIFFKDYPHTEF